MRPSNRSSSIPASKITRGALQPGAFRRQGIFAEVFVAAMRAAGLEPDSFLPEYGARQYEVTTGPPRHHRGRQRDQGTRDGPRHCPSARAIARSSRQSLNPNGTGNGVHIHMSLRTGDGRPAITMLPGPTA